MEQGSPHLIVEMFQVGGASWVRDLWTVSVCNTCLIGSMYGMFIWIYIKSQLNVGKYTTHGPYEYRKHFFLISAQHLLCKKHVMIDDGGLGRDILSNILSLEVWRILQVDKAGGWKTRVNDKPLLRNNIHHAVWMLQPSWGCSPNKPDPGCRVSFFFLLSVRHT